MDIPFQALTNSPVLYAKNNKEIEAYCSLSMFQTPPTFPPIAIILNLWFFVSTPTSYNNYMPNKATCPSPLQQPLHVIKLPPACSATSRHCHLPPHYQDNTMTKHACHSRVNLNSFNISAPDCHIRQHIGSNWSSTHMQKLANVLEIPVIQLYRHLICQSKPILPFEMKWSSEGKGPSLIGKFLIYSGTYLGFLGMIFITSRGIYCLKKFWCRPATPRHWPYTPTLSWHVIVNDDVEVALIYRSGGKVENSVRGHKNYNLLMEWEATRLGSHCKQSVLSKIVPAVGSLATKLKSRECDYNTWLIVRLRISLPAWCQIDRTGDSSLLILEHPEWCHSHSVSSSKKCSNDLLHLTHCKRNTHHHNEGYDTDNIYILPQMLKRDVCIHVVTMANEGSINTSGFLGGAASISSIYLNRKSRGTPILQIGLKVHKFWWYSSNHNEV